MSEKEGFKLGGIATLALLASLAADNKEAKAEPGIPGGQEVHDLVLCSISEGNGEWPGDGLMADDPKSAKDIFYPDSYDDLEKVPSSRPVFWKGYIIRSTVDYNTGVYTWRVYKVINGQWQENEVGQIPSDVGDTIGDFGLKSPEAGLILGDDLNFYKLIDTGETVVVEFVGSKPSLPGPIQISYGGYLFGEGQIDNPTKDNQVVILSEDDPTVVASIVTISTGTSFDSSGIDVDSQTGELVVSNQNGFKVAKLPPLDQKGKLSADFSLNDLAFSEKKEFKPGQQVSVSKVVASGGCKYFRVSGGKELIIVTPDDQIYVIDKTQLGIAGNCSPWGGCITGFLKLESGGLYLTFNDEMKIPPISLIPTADPAEFIAPGVPFKKIDDKPTDITKHTVDGSCTAVTGSDKDVFEPAVDLCANKTCEQPVAEPCKDAVCNSSTGACEDIAKPDGTQCTGPNKCVTSYSCKGGVCKEGATEKACWDGNPCISEECNPSTGECDTVLTNQPCDDGDPSTINDKCDATGKCAGEPIVNPEPDAVEPSPEPDDIDVVEQEPDSSEPDPDVVEQAPDIITPDTSEPDPDVIGETDNGDDSQGETGDSDVTNPEEDSNGSDADDEADVQGEDTGDTGSQAEIDVKPESQEESSADAGVDSSENDTIGADGCGCDAGGGTPNTANSTFLLGLGLALAGTVARFRDRIRSVLASRK